jgi:AbrB family looped-hinge helix DNA binding protein
MACQSADKRRVFHASTRDARCGTRFSPRTRNRALFTTNRRRRPRCSADHPIQRSRGPHWNATDAQPNSATHAPSIAARYFNDSPTNCPNRGNAVPAPTRPTVLLPPAGSAAPAPPAGRSPRPLPPTPHADFAGSPVSAQGAIDGEWRASYHAGKIGVNVMWTVSVSKKGQLVLPKEAREHLGLGQGGRVRVRVEGGTIVMDLAPESREAWARWKGVLRGSNALHELVAEHKAEVDRGK